MKNNKIISVGIIFTLFMTLRACGQMTTQVSVKDEQGNPIEGAEVSFYYARPQGYENVSKLTNADGMVKDTGETNFHLNVHVDKVGYYKATYAKSNKGTNLEKNQDHKLDVVLKKVINPIPLYAKNTKIYSEDAITQIGYDFEIGDWVKPYGKGKSVDVFFKIIYDKRTSLDFDYSFEVSFPNSLDGLQEFKGDDTSGLRSTHQAPEQGYLKKWKQVKQRRPNTGIIGNQDRSRNYWLRVRSQVDAEGNLTSAHYVKIYGDFPRIQYYFNPNPNDRNLEFDPEQNLFKNLLFNESVKQP